MKKNIFLILVAFVTLVMLPFKVNALTSDELIIDFQNYVPVQGKAPKDIVLDSDEYEIIFQKWSLYNGDGSVSSDTVTKFEYGKTYAFSMYIKAKGNGVSFLEDAPYVDLKNITWNNFDGAYRNVITNPDNQYYGCLLISGDYTVGTIHAQVEIVGDKSIIPIIGKTPQYFYILPQEYDIVAQEWYDENFNKATTFEAGKSYYYVMTLKHLTAYGWDGQSSFEITGIDWTSTYSYSDAREGTLTFAGTLTPVEGYEIKIEASDGVLIGQTGSLVVPKGGSRTLHILANDGYKITSVKVNGVEQILPLENDELILNNIQEEILVEVEAEEGVNELKQIELTEESINQEYIKGTDKVLTFILVNKGGTAKVFVDDVELSNDNGDYSVGFAENLPYVKISQTYLSKLKVGKHSIKFVIENVGEAETTFTVVAPVQEVPKTFDGISACMLIGSVSLICLIGVITYLKRSNIKG